MTEHEAVSLPSDPSERLGRLMSALQGPIDPPRVSWLYRAGLVAVAAGMVVLPLLYVLLAVATAWGVVLLDQALAGSTLEGRPLAFALGAVTVSGGTVVLFMFKPLFAPKRPQPDPYPVTRENQPVLFGFVDHLCQVVGAPVPASINLDCQVNASASFRRGLSSFLESDLNLTIGLPLVSGMSLGQLTGVLAHEFGHFAQGTGMRLTYVIRSVNHWFARVVYERDAWDETLASWTRQGGVWVGGIGLAAQGAVWLARRVLWGLMVTGHSISCFALRQMEYDADVYEIQVGGSDRFEATSRRLSDLSLASQVAHHQLAAAWTGRRLVNDLPAFIVARGGALDPAVLQQAREQALSRTTGLFDTHPSDADRIAAARRAATPGIFQLEAPASVLFREFDTVSLEVTRRHYALMIGDAFGAVQLMGVDHFMAEGLSDQEAGESLRQIFGPVLAPVRLAAFGTPQVAAPGDVERAVAELRTCIGEMNRTAAAARESMARFLDADSRMMQVHQNLGVAEAWATASGQATDSSIPEDVAALQADVRRLTAEAGAAAEDLDRYMAAAGRRFELALGLGQCAAMPGMAEALPPSAPDPGAMLQALAALAGQDTRLHEVRVGMARIFGALVEHNRDPERHGAMLAPIQNATRVLCNQLIGIRRSLDQPDPLQPDRPDVRLGALVIAQVPSADDVGQVLSAAQQGVGAAFTLRARLLAHASRIVRRVERIAAPDEPVNPLAEEQAE